jgi:hypothetical protein
MATTHVAFDRNGNARHVTVPLDDRRPILAVNGAEWSVILDGSPVLESFSAALNRAAAIIRTSDPSCTAICVDCDEHGYVVDCDTEEPAFSITMLRSGLES